MLYTVKSALRSGAESVKALPLAHPCVQLFLKRIQPVIEDLNSISDYQFDFRKHHCTLEQLHRIVDNIKESLGETK